MVYIEVHCYKSVMVNRQLNTIRWGFCVSHFAKNENCLADFIFYLK